MFVKFFFQNGEETDFWGLPIVLKVNICTQMLGVRQLPLGQTGSWKYETL